jgi:hypothetical protein
VNKSHEFTACIGNDLAIYMPMAGSGQLKRRLVALCTIPVAEMTQTESGGGDKPLNAANTVG